MANAKKIPGIAEVILSLVLILSYVSPIFGGHDCFTMAVGKNASADGHVLMAHNEDDGGPQIVHHRKISRRQYAPGEKVTLVSGGQLDQVKETWAYIWAEMPEMLFSDSYLNEWGVCIASDACLSREDNPELTEGGISYMLRALVAQRAKSAREGVKLAGELVERFGYNSSGRTYTICDPNEGWLFCAINGKHWLAKRVPDDEIAIIANTYTVHEVDLTDTINYLACSDIIDYAMERGWYKPDRDGEFDFAASYAMPENASDSANFCRQWGGLRHVSAEDIPLKPHLPFSIKPKTKLGVADLTKILRDHYEDTNLYQGDAETGDPHRTGMRTICTWTTQTSFVAQLRSNMPADIGLVYWVCLGPPCTSFFIPFHFGLAEFPGGYATDHGTPSGEEYQQNIKIPLGSDSQHAFWVFRNLYMMTCADYTDSHPHLIEIRTAFENKALEVQTDLENKAGKLYLTEKDKSLELLGDYSNELYLLAMRAMESIRAMNR
jgi:dipeptidase